MTPTTAASTADPPRPDELEPHAMADRLDQLMKMHQAQPDDADLTYMIGLEHGKASQFDEAAHWLEKTLEIDVHYHYAYFQKAKMLSQNNDGPAAIETAKRGLTQAAADQNQKAVGELEELLQSLG